ncbi:MAG TPA: hypothetical protein VFG22_02070 [Polyangiales bacterium]|nr:hypothetical protein [Polyangiales bacterium]
MTEAQLRSLSDLMETLPPGTVAALVNDVKNPIDIARPQLVVVVGYERTKGAINPVAGSHWKVIVAAPEGWREQGIFVSRIVPLAGEPRTTLQKSDIPGAIRPYSVAAKQKFTRERILDVFQWAATDAREIRFMATGNLLAAAEQVNNRGQIIMFTTSEGKVRQGILMPPSFTPNEFLNARPIKFSSVENIFKMMEARKPVFADEEGDMIVSLDGGGQTVRFNAVQAKRRGGKYYLHEKALAAAAPNQFVSGGGRMNMRVNLEQAKKVFEAYRASGIFFRPENTPGDRDIAARIEGIDSDVDSAFGGGGGLDKLPGRANIQPQGPSLKAFWPHVPYGEMNPLDDHLPSYIHPREGFLVDAWEATRLLLGEVGSNELRGAVMPKILGAKIMGLAAMRSMPGQSFIHVRDPRVLGTLTHEGMGHGLDFVLLGGKRRFHKTIKHRVPGIGIGEKALRRELTAASENFRPLPLGMTWQSNNKHIHYRLQNEELVADTLALYAIDPAAAEEKAPEFIANVKEQIAANAFARAIFNMLHNGISVGPTPPVSRSEQHTHIPPPLVHGPLALEPALRQQAIADARATKNLDAGRTARAYTFTRKLRRMFPETVRMDMHAAIEGTRNVFVDADGNFLKVKGASGIPLQPKAGQPSVVGVTVPGGYYDIAPAGNQDSYEKVMERLQANPNWPLIDRLLREARFMHEEARMDVNKIAEISGKGSEFLSWLPNYVGHEYQVPDADASNFAAKWITKTKHSKKRKYPTLADAVDDPDFPLRPLTNDLAFTMERWYERNYRAAATLKFVHDLRSLRTADGRKLIVHSHSDPDYVGSGEHQYVKVDIQALNRFFGTVGKDGVFRLFEGNTYVHPEIVRPLQAVLQEPMAEGTLRVINAINQYAKALNVSYSLFHHATLYESSTALNARPERGQVLRGMLIMPTEQHSLGIARGQFPGERGGIKSFGPMFTATAGHRLAELYGLEDSASAGLPLDMPASTDHARQYIQKLSRSVSAGTKGIPLVGRLAKLNERMLEAYNRHLWEDVHAGLVLFSYHSLVNQWTGRTTKDGVVVYEKKDQLARRGMSIEDARATAAHVVRNALGGQRELNLPRFGGDSGFAWAEPITIRQHQWIAQVVFAPDWTIAQIRQAASLPLETSRFVRRNLPQLIPLDFGLMDIPVVGKKLRDVGLQEGQDIIRALTRVRVPIRIERKTSSRLSAGKSTEANRGGPGPQEVNNFYAFRATLRIWSNMFGVLVGMMAAAQHAIYLWARDEDPDMQPFPWLNEPGHEFDIDMTPFYRWFHRFWGIPIGLERFYMSPGKQVKEIFRYFDDFPKGLIESAGNKAARLLQIIGEQAYGHSAGSEFPMAWTGTGFRLRTRGLENMGQRGLHILSRFAPFSLTGNTAFFTFPKRQGMTPWQAREQYTDLMRAWAEPGWWKRTKELRGISKEEQEKAVIDDLRRVDLALKLNGRVGRRDIFAQAKGRLKSAYLNRLIKEMERADDSTDTLVALMNLGATTQYLREAIAGKGGDEKSDAMAKKAEEDLQFVLDAGVRSRILDYDRLMLEGDPASIAAYDREQRRLELTHRINQLKAGSPEMRERERALDDLIKRRKAGIGDPNQ